MPPVIFESGSDARRCECRAASELVWDGGDAATAVNRSGQSLRIADDWTPEALFSLGVEADLMTTFLQFARHAALEILAYVSASHLAEGEDGSKRLELSACIVVSDAAGVALAEELWHAARHTAALAELLGSSLDVEASITAISGAGGTDVRA